MVFEVKLDANIDAKQLAKDFEALKNDTVMYEIHDLFAKMCDPYVPMDTGNLAQGVDISKDSIKYPGPYAHYMYMGEVYGPNIPIIEDGIVVGWFSPKGKPKHPTGRPINYSTESHPLASKEWDKAMMRDKSEVFLDAVKDILIKRCKELYG